MNGNKEMPGYMTYREAALIFSMLPDNEAAAAIKATVYYFLRNEIPPGDLSPMASSVFSIMKDSIDRGRNTYQSKVEGGRKGAMSRYGKKQATFESSLPVNDSGNDRYDTEVENWTNETSM